MSMMLWALRAVACVMVFSGGVAVADEPAADRNPGGQAGLRIDIDPDTGATLQQPVGRGAPDTTGGLSARTSTSSAGLVEEEGKTAAGGTTVHLGSRFQNSMSVHVGPHDETTSNCTNAPSAQH